MRSSSTIFGVFVIDLERLVERGQKLGGQDCLHFRFWGKPFGKDTRRAGLTHALFGASEQLFELWAEAGVRDDPHRLRHDRPAPRAQGGRNRGRPWRLLR